MHSLAGNIGIVIVNIVYIVTVNIDNYQLT
jgi:hypothetical protein